MLTTVCAWVALSLINSATGSGASSDAGIDAIADAEQWLPMPDGRWYHASCVHRHSSAFHVDTTRADGVLVQEDGLPDVLLPPCPFPSRASAGQQLRDSGEEPLPLPKGLGRVQYYSDWSVYAQHAEPSALFSAMVSTWAVPAKPLQRGPAGLSAVYLFNGLEDGGGQKGKATLILQPVLQHGRSGCLLSPLAWGDWHLGSYLVDGSGRAHCGTNFKVQTGDRVVGNMTRTDAASNRWSVQSSVLGRSGPLSTYSATIGAKVDTAYVTLEGMVIYNCAAYPPGNGTVFEHNVLVDGNGRVLSSPAWTPEARHSDCAQAVTVDGGGGVMLHYDSSK